MAQACATFGFNPNIVPSPSQRNLRSQQASSTQGSSGSISQRTSDSTTSSVRSAWDVLIIERFTQDFINWDLERIGILRDTLREWALMNIPFSKIGRYLELILYNNDEHMDGRLTHMVNMNFPHIRIAIITMEFFQIRDDNQFPLWHHHGQNYGDWSSIAGVHSVPVIEDSRYHTQGIPVSPTHPGPRPALQDEEQPFDARSSDVPSIGPQLLVYHHANPSAGRFVDEEGNIVLMQPPVWM